MDEKLMRHGAFSWFELMTSDVDAAKKFYSEVFGWGIKDMPMENMAYSVLSVEGEDVAGLMGMPPDAGEMPPVWGIYITVNNVDETIKKATALGASVFVEPRDIPDVGRFAVIQDPQGAYFSIIAYK